MTSAAPAATGSRPTAPAPKVRDPWFDNAKMTLVVLVVIGHAWTLLPLFSGDQGSGTAKLVDGWAYHFLYAWHIPAFVIVTGYLSRSFEYTRARMTSLLTTVALPYVVFEGLLVWFRHEFGGVEFERIWANPHWPMWYLSALFFWRLATPVFTRLPAKVVVATAISLAAGLFATDTLDNARILGLLPFFVLGLKMHEGHWNLIRSRRARWYGFAVLLLMAVAARWAGDLLETEWFYYRTRYDALDPDNLRAFVIRMGMLLSGLVGAFAFFAVVPRTRTWFSAMGGATLVVYLYHGFVVLGAEFLGYKGWAADHWPVSLVLTTLAAVALALVLAWQPVSSRLNVLVDPVGSFQRARRRRRDRDPSSA
ncbi:Fucose 4-O-acetylase [Nocardioides scoriae]|uniref:Fucose 4-O-acetylase n=1 Tax=Nocardioides scoriae TaxID=642780 RepID=A0A1H1TDN8_9ACTN|nr:acyltransferase family protein [Nocardioides scoriae]SDS58278.1 Fucose 4-O-acetylase [Nocardioides scoriae]